MDIFRSEAFLYQNIHGELCSMRKASPTASFSFEAGLMPPSLAHWNSRCTGGVPNEQEFGQEGSLETQAALLLPLLY